MGTRCFSPAIIPSNEAAGSTGAGNLHSSLIQTDNVTHRDYSTQQHYTSTPDWCTQRMDFKKCRVNASAAMDTILFAFKQLNRVQNRKSWTRWIARQCSAQEVYHSKSQYVAIRGAVHTSSMLMCAWSLDDTTNLTAPSTVSPGKNVFRRNLQFTKHRSSCWLLVAVLVKLLGGESYPCFCLFFGYWWCWCWCCCISLESILYFDSLQSHRV